MLNHLRARYPILAGFLLVFVGIFIGEYFALYYRIAMFDKVLHTAGGAIAAWFVLALMLAELTHMQWWKQMLIIVSVTVFIGTTWEWAEYLGNFTRSSAPWLYHYFHGGDLADTLGDLVADTIGALGMVAWALRKERTL